MYDLSDLPNKVTYCNWRTGMVLMTQEIINYLTTIIFSILFPLARWATIERPSNSPPTFPIATEEWATVKRTPCKFGTQTYASPTTEISNTCKMRL